MRRYPADGPKETWQAQIITKWMAIKQEFHPGRRYTLLTVAGILTAVYFIGVYPMVCAFLIKIYFHNFVRFTTTITWKSRGKWRKSLAFPVIKLPVTTICPSGATLSTGTGSNQTIGITKSEEWDGKYAIFRMLIYSGIY